MPAILQEPKINVHKAVKAAIEFFEKSFAMQKTSNLQLEEVELSEDGCFWLITLGYDDPAAITKSTLSDMVMPGVASFRPRPLRKYKVVRVNAENGKTVAVKNRE